MSRRPRWRYAEQVGRWVLAAEWTAGGEPVVELGSAAAGSLTAIAPAVRARVAEAMLEQHGIRPPAAVFDGPPGAQVTMTCGLCWTVSFDPGRVASRVCAGCGVAEAGVPVPRQRAGDVASSTPGVA